DRRSPKRNFAPGSSLAAVIAGLGPAIHQSWQKLFPKKMDARVKPAHDEWREFLRRKPEMHDVAVGDDVRFALEPHLARLLRAGFAAERHIIVVGDGLGANEAALEVGMDDGGRLRRFGAARDRRRRRLLGAGGEIGN